jgi:hypothetical protein
MKRFAAYLFCTLYLLSTTESYQLLKIPIIVEHFHQHQKNNKDITLLEFIDIHYMHGSPVDDDYEQDMHLPFKRVNHNVNMTPAHVKTVMNISFILALLPQGDDFVVVDDPRIQSKYLTPVFQPPKA